MAKKLAGDAAKAPADKKANLTIAAKAAAAKQKTAEATMAKAVKRMKTVTAAAPKDIVDIVVSEPKEKSVIRKKCQTLCERVLFILAMALLYWDLQSFCSISEKMPLGGVRLKN